METAPAVLVSVCVCDGARWDFCTGPRVFLLTLPEDVLATVQPQALIQTPQSEELCAAVWMEPLSSVLCQKLGRASSQLRSVL